MAAVRGVTLDRGRVSVDNLKLCEMLVNSDPFGLGVNIHQAQVGAVTKDGAEEPRREERL